MPGGTIPSGATLTVPAGTTSGSYFVSLCNGSSSAADAPFTVTGGASLTCSLNPTSGAVGKSILLSGTGFAASTTYDYGFGSSPTSLLSALFSFTTTAGGAIPSNTYLNVPNTLLPGPAYVDVVLPTSSVIVISATFTVTALTPPSRGIGHSSGYTITIDGVPFNLYESIDFEDTLDLQVNQGQIVYPDFLSMISSNAVGADIVIYRDGVLDWRGIGIELPTGILISTRTREILLSPCRIPRHISTGKPSTMALLRVSLSSTAAALSR